jgi:hypothetical protein
MLRERQLCERTKDDRNYHDNPAVPSVIRCPPNARVHRTPQLPGLHSLRSGSLPPALSRFLNPTVSRAGAPLLRYGCCPASRPSPNPPHPDVPIGFPTSRSGSTETSSASRGVFPLTKREIKRVIPGPMPFRCLIHPVYKGDIQIMKDLPEREGNQCQRRASTTSCSVSENPGKMSGVTPTMDKECQSAHKFRELECAGESGVRTFG